jgi:hypothetical protein
MTYRYADGWKFDRQEELDMTDDTEKKSEGAGQAPVYFHGAYDEAFDLLVEARDYVENDVAAFKYAANPRSTRWTKTCPTDSTIL